MTTLRNTRYDNIWTEWIKEDSMEEEGEGEEGKKQQQWEGEDESRCEDCGTESIQVSDGALTCTRCGRIYGSVIDSSAEWRYYGNDDNRVSSDPSRCGISSNYLNPDQIMGTLIRYQPKESYNMRKIRQYHCWNSMNYKGRSLYNQFELLSLRCGSHGIPSIIVEHTKQLYKKITDQQLFRGENKNGLIAICMFRACKDKHVPRSIKEIAAIFDVDEQIMTKGNRCFSKVWNVLSTMKNDDDHDIEEDLKASLARPSHYVERFSCRLGIPASVVADILRVTDLVENKGMIADNTPASIATAVIFMVCQMHSLGTTKADIAKASQISEVTISKCFKKLNVYTDYIRQEIFSTRGKGERI
jgi:transcription initiation factor TFIIB